MMSDSSIVKTAATSPRPKLSSSKGLYARTAARAVGDNVSKHMQNAETIAWKKRNKIAWCKPCNSQTVQTIHRDRFNRVAFIQCQACKRNLDSSRYPIFFQRTEKSEVKK